jgi:hypothetical protein
MLFVALTGLSALSMHAEFFQWAGCRTRTLVDWINDTEAAETVEATYPFLEPSSTRSAAAIYASPFPENARKYNVYYPLVRDNALTFKTQNHVTLTKSSSSYQVYVGEDDEVCGNVDMSLKWFANEATRRYCSYVKLLCCASNPESEYELTISVGDRVLGTSTIKGTELSTVEYDVYPPTCDVIKFHFEDKAGVGHLITSHFYADTYRAEEYESGAKIYYARRSTKLTTDHISEFKMPELLCDGDGDISSLSLKYVSTNTDVAKVDASGNVTLTGKPGRAAIRVRTADSELNSNLEYNDKAQHIIEVNEPSAVRLDLEPARYDAGGVKKLDLFTEDLSTYATVSVGNTAYYMYLDERVKFQSTAPTAKSTTMMAGTWYYMGVLNGYHNSQTLTFTFPGYKISTLQLLYHAYNTVDKACTKEFDYTSNPQQAVSFQISSDYPYIYSVYACLVKDEPITPELDPEITDEQLIIGKLTATQTLYYQLKTLTRAAEADDAETWLTAQSGDSGWHYNAEAGWTFDLAQLADDQTLLTKVVDGASGTESEVVDFVRTTSGEVITSTPTILAPAASDSTHSAYYDLYGRRLPAPPAHGLVIHNHRLLRL